MARLGNSTVSPKTHKKKRKAFTLRKERQTTNRLRTTKKPTKVRVGKI